MNVDQKGRSRMVNTPLIPYMCFKIKFIENIEVNSAHALQLGTNSSGSCWECAWRDWSKGNALVPSTGWGKALLPPKEDI